MHKRKYNPAIDLLKFLFAIVIVLFHGFKNLPIGFKCFINGRLAVEFFFAVSGFFMVSSFLRGESSEESASIKTVRYSRKRISAIFPQHFMAWFIAMTVTGISLKASPIVFFKRILAGLFELFFLTNAGFTGLTRVNHVVWYLSAMILAMAILYPLMAWKSKAFINLIAPMITIFGYGYLSRQSDTPFTMGSQGWLVVLTAGLLRAIAGICLGVVIYRISSKIRTIDFTKLGRIILYCTEVISYLLFVIYIYSQKSSQFDFVMVAIVALALVVTFSNRWIIEYVLRRSRAENICLFLGKYSIAIFLSHACWCHELTAFFPEVTGLKMLMIYLCCVIVTSVIVMTVGNLLKRKMPYLKRLLIE